MSLSYKQCIEKRNARHAYLLQKTLNIIHNTKKENQISTDITLFTKILITYSFDKGLMQEIFFILVRRMQNGTNSQSRMLQNYICIYPMALQLLYIFDIK